MKLLIYWRCLEASCSLLRSFMQLMVASCLGTLKAHNLIMDSGREDQIPSLCPEEAAAGRRLLKVCLIHFSTHHNEVPVGRWVCRREPMEGRSSWFLPAPGTAQPVGLRSAALRPCGFGVWAWGNCWGEHGHSSTEAQLCPAEIEHCSNALPPKWEAKLATFQGSIL